MAEAGLVSGIEIHGATRFADVCRWLRGDAELDDEPPPVDGLTVLSPDMADVVGPGTGAPALEIAAAGMHHILMTGPPGIGKTMLARRLPGIPCPRWVRTRRWRSRRSTPIAGHCRGDGRSSSNRRSSHRIIR